MERQVHHFGFADLSAGHNRRYRSFLDEVQKILRWNIIEKKLQQHLSHHKTDLRGNPSYPALSMFKILMLQRWYNLSDQETEYSLNDRISFSRFAGFSLDSPLPDHTTICRFRNRLLGEDILATLLEEVNNQLIDQGKLVKEGCVVDATIISSSRRPLKTIDVSHNRDHCTNNYVEENGQKNDHFSEKMVNNVMF